MTTVASIIRLNSTVPAAPSGYANVKPQQDGNFPINDVSEYAPNVGGVDSRFSTVETIGIASQGKLVNLDSASPIAVTLDSTVPASFTCSVQVTGVGTATLTPSSGQINDAANITLSIGQSAHLFFDGTNWWAAEGAGGAGTVTHTGALTSGELIVGNGGADIKVGDLTGDVTTAGSTATTVAKIQGTTVSGITGTTNVVFSASPALTGSPTVPTQTALDSSTKAASTAYVDAAVSTGTSGKFGFGGDGSDSTVHFDGVANPVAGATLSGTTYTLTRDVWATNLTVDSGITVKMANWRLFATGTATINGNINNDGQTASVGNNAGSATAGTGGALGQSTTSATDGSLPHQLVAASLAGGNGGNGQTGVGTAAAAPSVGTQNGAAAIPGGGAGTNGSTGGKGGNGTPNGGGGARAGGAGGITAGNIAARPARLPFNAQEFGFRSLSVPSNWVNYQGYQSTNGASAGGSGGGGDGANSGGGGGGAGGTGGYGGITMLSAFTIIIGATGVISAQGGVGGQGGNGFAPTAGNAGGGGGGAGGDGGPGGYVILIYRTLTNSGTIQYAGGGGGTHGTGAGGHGSGTAGDNGNDGGTGPTGALIEIAC